MGFRNTHAQNDRSLNIGSQNSIIFRMWCENSSSVKCLMENQAFGVSREEQSCLLSNASLSHSAAEHDSFCTRKRWYCSIEDDSFRPVTTYVDKWPAAEVATPKMRAQQGLSGYNRAGLHHHSLMVANYHCSLRLHCCSRDYHGYLIAL